MLPLHASELACYQRCPREHQHAYVARRVPLLRPEALTRGTSVHRWLNQWWSTDGYVHAANMPEDPIARACCLGYAAYYERPHLEHVKVEAPWQVRLGSVECAGTVDAIGFEPYAGDPVRGFYPGTGGVALSGDEIIVEHKTTSSDISPGSAYWREVSLTNTQASMYAAAFPGAKLLWDAIRKPAIRKLRAGKSNEETDDELCARALALITENPDKYYQRQYIVRLEHEHASFINDIELVDAQRRVLQQPRNAKACWSFGRRCGYFQVCWESETLDNDALFTQNTHGLPTEENES